ncbi:hypothetical protein PQD72_gp23 [Shewanella phage X14]|uniref:Uncharacterized protein n=1 Tax=Shewanella phage X14 TaxID=2576871 RepID=A0A4P8NMX6_9CAUD|nr:hypothetical protein PQD72_gp23 [Shewanella phage X14]QCQ65296.1 hypothetical protein X14_000023 [Shewanella phage X14]
MDYSLKQKILMFICKHFGHKEKKGEAWEFGGKRHFTCQRCRIVQSNNQEAV